MERQAWLVEARKKVYATQKDWAQALNKLGFNVPQSTIANWEAAGFLPTSLDYKAINLVSDSLGMTANEVMRRQGVKIVQEIETDRIPSPIVNLVKKLVACDDEVLEKLAPQLEDYFDFFYEHIKKD